ncbi:MAG: glycosyltransferase [Spirochaetaceae bacterium]|nr:glycosyltransferase [Spirochaetaceae bacterium]
MEKNILLSIIVPCYNSGAFLEKTLSMLVSQGLDSVEVVVVNDGSADNTKEIADSFAEKYSQFKILTHCENGIWLSKESKSAPGPIRNRGMSAARNTGLQSAKGKYIYFFDSDDALADGTLDFFRKMISVNPNIDGFAFGYEVVVDGLRKKIYTSKDTKDLGLQDNIFGKYLSKKLQCNICSVIFSASYLLNHNIPFFKEKISGEDISFLLPAIAFAKSMYYDNRICFRYQIRGDSIMQGYKKYGTLHSTAVLTVKKTIEGLIPQKIDYERNLNFFMAVYYVYNLKLYLTSKLPAGEAAAPVNNVFIENKYLLNKKMSGKFSLKCIVFCVRIFPLKLLFKIFGKFDASQK